MPFPPNRRKSVRYASQANRSWLAWQVDGENAQVPGRLWDISQSGASVLVETAPPLRAQETAWIRMESPAPSDWVEASVVDVTPMTKKRFWGRDLVVGHLVRVAFVGACPYEVFKSATHGNQLDATFKQSGPTEADGVIWR